MTCHCPQCTTNPLPTCGEGWREATEARYVARLPSDQYRTAYLSGVAVKRGSMASQRLRRLALDVMQDNAKVSGSGTASAGLPGYAGDNNGERK